VYIKVNGLPYPVLVELGISDDMLVPGQNQCRCHLILCNQVPEAVTSLALNPRPTPAMREQARELARARDAAASSSGNWN
jgi:hypothetical protein